MGEIYMMYIKEEDKKKNKENIYLVIGKNIQRIRKDKNLTGEELANLCNLSYGYIKNLESKKVHATISIETLKLIADKLNVTLSEFFDEDYGIKE